MFKVLIAGGGPAAIEAVLTLADRAPAADVTLLAPNDEFVYRPLSVVEPFARAGVRRYRLAELESAGATVLRGTLASVDAGAKVAVTGAGERVSYDAALIATGVPRQAAVPGATTFTGPEAVEAMHGIVQDVEAGYIRSLAFFAPPETGWTLPLYELALQTAERAYEMSASVDMHVVTPEERPLDVFGLAAADFTSSRLDAAGITFTSGTEAPEADRVIALGVPQPPAIPGLPAGFLPVDVFCAVRGADGVWAAGDVTDSPVKQGGLATQQASVAAQAIAAGVAGERPTEPYLPVLRAMLITGRRTCYFRRRLDGIDPGQASHRALWWPPSKIAGKRLAPFLDELDARDQTVSLERRIASRRGRVRAVIATGAKQALT
jgi:sulfide:quinone oxidoreductase